MANYFEITLLKEGSSFQFFNNIREQGRTEENWHSLQGKAEHKFYVFSQYKREEKAEVEDIVSQSNACSE